MEVKERIISAAEILFMRYGVRSVTMDDIAKELGISKKTIYIHFADKNTIVREVTSARLAKEREMVSELHKVSMNPIEEIIVSMKLLRDLSSEVNPIIFFDLKKYHPESWALYKQHKEFFREVVKRNLHKGIELNYYRPDIVPEILARLRIECVEMAFDPEIFPSNTFNLVDVQLQFIDHFLKGILTPLGLSVYEELTLH